MSIGIATLSENDRERHIILGLTHSSPISIFKMCDAGYKAVFTYTNIYIIKDEKNPNRNKGKTTGLWRLPIEIIIENTQVVKNP